MLEAGASISGTTCYYCSFCGGYLFRRGFEIEAQEDHWEFCPYCGTPLYERKNIHAIHKEKR